ncbi:MAG: hypothetical protein K8R90_05770 [Candidatus Cloacimonetes bacterium]|nr:hypothetical protein [Candidatus Cloacimonadota bacterium]
MLVSFNVGYLFYLASGVRLYGFPGHRLQQIGFRLGNLLGAPADAFWAFVPERSVEHQCVQIGAFDTARIPALDASKISTGAFNVDRIPTLAQSKISDLTTALEGKVETTTKVNGIALDRDIVLKSTDIIEEVAELPLDGIIGELIAFEGVLYVWKGAQ